MLPFDTFRINHGRTPKFFVLDNAAEKLQLTLRRNRCEHVPTSTFLLEENGIAERLNRALLTAICADLHSAEIDDRFWPIALKDAVYKYKLRLQTTTGHTPLHEWLGVDATPKRILVFGQLGVV